MMNRLLFVCLAIVVVATFAAPVQDVEEVVPEQVMAQAKPDCDMDTPCGKAKEEGKEKKDDYEQEYWNSDGDEKNYDIRKHVIEKDHKDGSSLANDPHASESDTDEDADTAEHDSDEMEGQVKREAADMRKEMAKVDVEQKKATPLYTCHQMCGIFHEKATCDKCAAMEKKAEAARKKAAEAMKKLQEKRDAEVAAYLKKDNSFLKKMFKNVNKKHRWYMKAVRKHWKAYKKVAKKFVKHFGSKEKAAEALAKQAHEDKTHYVGAAKDMNCVLATGNHAPGNPCGEAWPGEKDAPKSIQKIGGGLRGIGPTSIPDATINKYDNKHPGSV